MVKKSRTIKKLRTLSEVTEVFLAYAPPDMKGQYQLDRMKKLLAFLGNPQEKIKTIHVAGTSGKTSTSYFIRGMLEAAGQRTGLTASPHIVAINERVQIDGVPLDEARFLVYVNQFLALIAEIDLDPTYFELLVALAYYVFAEENVDYVVSETGLGGTLDATNTISRADKVCVITDIGLDHTKILGDTIPEIAVQKAGIIQSHNYVIMNNQSDEIMRVFSEVVQKNVSELKVIMTEDSHPELPTFQQRNFTLAEATFEYVKKRDVLPDITKKKLEQVALQSPPGRYEMYYFKDKTIILDGAHNPQKMQALCDTLRAKGITKCAVLANFSEAPTLKIETALEILRPFATHLIIPEFMAGQDLKSRHSLPTGELAQYAKSFGYLSIEQKPDVSEALEVLLKRPEKVLLITGSLYLVSAIRPLLIDHAG